MTTATFICGCGHSGTSLLANMFASHSDVFIPFRETEIFLDPENSAKAWAALVAEAHELKRSNIVEKTPRHVHAIPVIKEIVPEARVLAMVRDGRDVAASYIKRFGSAEKGRKRWVLDNTALLAAQHDTAIKFVRYEDLISEPATTLKEACAFAGLRYDPKMLEFHKTERLWFGVNDTAQGNGQNGIEHRMLRNWQINQPLFDGRGQWKTLLSESDLIPFEQKETKILMEHFGYC